MPNYTIAADPNFNISTSWQGRNLAIDVAGVLWATYTRRFVPGQDRVYAAYSNDGGATWTEEDVSVDANNHWTPVIAIDSAGIVHVAYTARGRAPFAAAAGVFYKQRSLAGVWSAEETVSLQDTGIHIPDSSIAIDSGDNVHCVIDTKGYGSFPDQWQVIYRKRTAGVWGAVVQITDIDFPSGGCAGIAIDSSDVVHLVWNGKGWGADPTQNVIVYCKSPAWVPEVVNEIADAWLWANSTGSIAVDSSNKPYIAWIVRVTIGDNKGYYSVKNGAWSARERVDAADGLDSYNIGIAIDKNDNLHFVYSGWPFNPPGLPINILYRRKVGGIWQDQVNITENPSDEQAYPVILWATWPQIAGIRTNIPLTQQRFIWKSKGVGILFGVVALVVLPTVVTLAATGVT